MFPLAFHAYTFFLQASGELQEMFGLSAEENLVESFKCKMLQTYACNHNSFTPAIQVCRTAGVYMDGLVVQKGAGLCMFRPW